MRHHLVCEHGVAPCYYDKREDVVHERQFGAPNCLQHPPEKRAIRVGDWIRAKDVPLIGQVVEIGTVGRRYRKRKAEPVLHGYRIRTSDCHDFIPKEDAILLGWVVP